MSCLHVCLPVAASQLCPSTPTPLAARQAAIANADCDRCPTGVTTTNGTFGALLVSPANCSILMPGFEISANATLGTTNATECGVDTYRAAEATIIASNASIPCTPCGNGLVTLPNVTGAISSDACLAPPGYGWSNNTNNTAGMATVCPRGSFNPGYNREGCTVCGNGTISTAAAGATSPDDCYTPAGNGNFYDEATGLLTGYICPRNTYGTANNTYGQVDVQCTKVCSCTPLGFLVLCGEGSRGCSTSAGEPSLGTFCQWLQCLACQCNHPLLLPPFPRPPVPGQQPHEPERLDQRVSVRHRSRLRLGQPGSQPVRLW